MTDQPETPETVDSTVAGDELAIVHPATGERLELTAATSTLADTVLELDELVRRLDDFRAAIVEEVARRMDRVNTRKERLENIVTGDVYELEVNTPTSETYAARVLEERLEALVEADVIDRELVDRVVKWTKPPAFTPARRADLREVAKLKKSTDERVLAAIAAARTISPNKRTLKVQRGRAQS